MGTYFNPSNAGFRQAVNSRIYIDKTQLIDILNSRLFTEEKCISVSHARRFGKSQAARMIDAYYSKGCDSRELFSKFEEKRIQGKYNEYLKRVGKYDLLIIDEFLLKPTNESERSDLLELMEIRCNKKSTIFCSQYSFDGWHQLLDGGPIADAILDRIINSSYLITLHGKSLREEYSRIKQ